MKRRDSGFTLVEMIAGLGVVTVLVWVLVPMMRAGLANATRARGQAHLLGEARRAFAGEGSYLGLVLSAQQGVELTSFSATGFYVKGTDLTVTTYTVSGSNLYSARSGTSKKRARGVEALSVKYYMMDSNYQIVLATSATSAQMATFTFNSPRTQRTVRFFTGGKLRNRR